MYAEQSTQDYPLTNNNVTAKETMNPNSDEENVEGRSGQRKTANQRAADEFIAQLEERNIIGGATQSFRTGAMGSVMGSANVKRVSAEGNKRQERNNAVHVRHRDAKKRKGRNNLTEFSNSSILEPLQLIMGRDKGSIEDNAHLDGQNIAWAHRTILGQATRSVQ